MANFIKHVGKHGDRKVAIVYKSIPDEEHMALVIYPDQLPRTFHDSIMSVIESDPGQQENELADVLFRNVLPDGRPILQTLHQEGMIKKVRTNDIIVTPNAQSHVRLDELNKIVLGLEEGDEAAKKMAELDAQSGLVDPVEKAQNAQAIAEAGEGVLGDDTLATDMLDQSKQMAAEAAQLVAESKRLEKEAFKLNPALKPKRKTAKKKTAAKKKAAS